MCGFVMVLSPEAGRNSGNQAANMARIIAHRGPDDSGEFNEHGISIAFRRLSIFDLAESGHQPMFSADDRYVIVFNGAIFNFIELRTELTSLGHRFRSTGDTEVLLAAYLQWGSDCLRRLNGMFAFVIYNRANRRIFAARDRFGVKPLFWYHDQRGLVLASELKAIRDSGYATPQANWAVIADFLLEQRLDETDETFYEGVRRVPPGTWFESDGKSEPAFRRWWTMDAIETGTVGNPIEEFADLFDDAIRIRMRSDVPVGVLLSGGLDSTSIITSMAEHARQTGQGGSRLDALCYHDAAFDESPYVSETIERTGATLCRLVPDEHQLWSLLDNHVWHQDEPVHSFTSVVTYQLMQLAKERGLKVLLNGQGADEVLAGYADFYMDYWTDLARSGQLRRAYEEIDAFARGNSQSAAALRRNVATRVLRYPLRYVPGYARLSALRRRARIQANRLVSDDIKRKWAPRELSYPRTLNESLRLAVENEPLPLFLRVEDRNSMAHAVEVRLPFLDHRLVTFSFQLPGRWKLRGPHTKVVLREAMRGRIPDSVRTRVKKFGFPTSVSAWFRGRLYERCRDVLASRSVRESGVWNNAELDRALDRHANGTEDFGNRLFDVVQFTAWYSMSRFGMPAEAPKPTDAVPPLTHVA